MEVKNNNYDELVSFYRMSGEDVRLLDVFYTNDYPIPYKNLTFYPFQVDLYILFDMLSESLVLPQKTTGDIKAITMSYLDYLVYLAQEKGKQQYLFQLGELLALSLKLKPSDTFNGHNVYDITIFKNDNSKNILRIEGKDFDSHDFDIIRKILVEQNGLELPDEETHPDIVQAWKSVSEYKRKQQNIHPCKLEDQINVIVAKTGYKRSEVLEMTIRSFKKLLERIDKVMHYEMYTLLSPMLDKNTKIPYYLEGDKSRLEKYSEAFTDEEEFKKKIK